MDGGQWTAASRNGYNLRDAVSRCTTQVTKSIIFLHLAHFKNKIVIFDTVNAGVSPVLDCHLCGTGQRRNVELEV